jgi:hypothetical protein
MEITKKNRSNMSEDKQMETEEFFKDLKADFTSGGLDVEVEEGESKLMEVGSGESVINVPDVDVEPMMLPKGAFTIGKRPSKNLDEYRKKRNKRNKAAKKSRRINRK